MKTFFALLVLLFILSGAISCKRLDDIKPVSYQKLDTGHYRVNNGIISVHTPDSIINYTAPHDEIIVYTADHQFVISARKNIRNNTNFTDFLLVNNSGGPVAQASMTLANVVQGQVVDNFNYSNYMFYSGTAPVNVFNTDSVLLKANFVSNNKVLNGSGYVGIVGTIDLKLNKK